MSDQWRYEPIEIIWDDEITHQVMEVDVDKGHVGVYVYVDDGIFKATLNKKQVHNLVLALQRAEKRLS